MENNQPNFLTLGSIQGPHLDIIGRPGLDRFIILQDAIDIIGDPRSEWRTFKRLVDLLKDEKIEGLEALNLLQFAGFCGFIPGDPEQDESVVPAIVFFYYPPDLTPYQALLEIESYLDGTFPASIAAGILAAAPFLEQEKAVVQGLNFGFVAIAGSTPSSGISSLTDSAIEGLVRDYVNELALDGVKIAQFMPKCAVDRAKFLVTLAEFCWKPEILSTIARARHNQEYISHLIMLATPWLYLNLGAEVEVAGVKIPVFRDQEKEIDLWLQSLEWDAHQITPQALQFLLPEAGHPVEGFYLDFPLDLPEICTAIALEMAKLLLARASNTPPTNSIDHFRLELPDGFFFFRDKNISGMRIHGNTSDGFWVGLETPTGISTSFWWSPQPEMPLNWITMCMDMQTRAFLHLTLTCFWYDFSALDRSEFPNVKKFGRQAKIPQSSWGTQKDISQIFLLSDILAWLKDLKNTEIPASEIAEKLMTILSKSYSPLFKVKGRAALTTFMEMINRELAGF